MGISVEFNPDLALRAFGTPNRNSAECLPKILKEGEEHSFLKKGQRNYWLEGEIPLLETKGNQKLSRPLASVTILKATHFKYAGGVYTSGIYRINSIFNPKSKKINFESYRRT